MKCSVKDNPMEFLGDGPIEGCRIIPDPVHADIDLALGRLVGGKIETNNVGQIVPGQKLAVNL